mmetsp:Transcript_90674/g.272347  ORF Transcript_90674/g.272347 Transcript_90674/m.272347 type:complete len:110 (+) Transcript_90674:226-555(+)
MLQLKSPTRLPPPASTIVVQSGRWRVLRQDIRRCRGSSSITYCDKRSLRWSCASSVRQTTRSSHTSAGAHLAVGFQCLGAFDARSPHFDILAAVCLLVVGARETALNGD